MAPPGCRTFPYVVLLDAPLCLLPPGMTRAGGG